MLFKYLKRCSKSVIKKGTQIKTKGYHFFTYEMVIYEKTFPLSSIGESMATRAFSVLADGSVIGTVSLEGRTALRTSSNPTFGNLCHGPAWALRKSYAQ